ncbi:MAG: hypothetical protein QOG60_19 [Frankiaceae bacterium]|jgi:hypothetical protein|nr:hypothetical protein [Frankiaceae bacterium]
MAKQKVVPLLIVAGIATAGVLAYGTLTDEGASKAVRVADPGGGPVAASPPPPAPFAISTLGAVGTAAQDPGGGGGGTGPPGSVGNPGIQGAQGGRAASVVHGTGNTLYFSGVSTLDPNRSAATSGQNTFGGPGVGSATGPLGGSSASSTTCKNPPQETEYDAIPLRNNVTFSGNPRVHLNISGGGSVTALLYQQLSNKSCQLVGQGTAGIGGGTADVTLGVGGHTFPTGVLPVVVLRANDGASHTVTTSNQNPSYLLLPNLTGV